MSKETKLKPCPFCKSEDVYMVECRESYVFCDRCYARGPCHIIISDAAKEWNDYFLNVVK